MDLHSQRPSSASLLKGWLKPYKLLIYSVKKTKFVCIKQTLKTKMSLLCNISVMLFTHKITC